VVLAIHHLILFYALFFFFLKFLIPASLAYAKYPYSVARRYYFFLLFAHCRQTSHSLSVSFPHPEFSLARSLALALGLESTPSLLFIIFTGARYVLLFNNMTQRCCYLLYPSFLSLLFYRSRAQPYISYPSLSLRLDSLASYHMMNCSLLYKPLCPSAAFPSIFFYSISRN